MAKVFISYRRMPSAMLATLIAKELEARGIEVFVDTRKGDGGGPFPRHLLQAIEDHDIFVCLLTDTTFESDWVKREIDHAFTMGKTMIPVFQESFKSLPETPDTAIEMLLMSQGVHVLDQQNLYVDEAIERLAAMIESSVSEPAYTPGDTTEIGERTYSLRPDLPKPRRWLWLIASLIIILLGILLFQWVNTPIINAAIAGTQTAIALATAPCSPEGLCDVFSQGTDGEFFTFQSSSASLSVEFTTECARSSVYGVQIEYSIPEGGYGGWGVHWENTANGSYNASDFAALVFWVTGSTSSNGFEVGLRQPDAVETKVESVDFVAVSDSEWKMATLPLSAFTGIDLTSIGNINFGFNERHGSGDICIDDIAFVS